MAELYNVSSTASSRTLSLVDQKHHHDHTHIKQQNEITARAPQWRLCFHWELLSQRLSNRMLTPTTTHKHTPLWHGLSAATSNSNKVLGVATVSSHPNRKWCTLGVMSQVWPRVWRCSLDTYTINGQIFLCFGWEHALNSYLLPWTGWAGTGKELGLGH